MLRLLPPMIEPDEWTLAFHTTSKYWFIRLLACDRYKHVSAFAWVGAYRMWVYYDLTLFGTKIMLLPDSDAATAWIVSQTDDADLMRMPRLPGLPRARIAPFYCVTAVKHLLNIPGGALRLSTLYRDCLRHGGRLIHGRTGQADALARADCTTAPGAG